MKLTVKTLDNAAAGDIEVRDDVFGLEARSDILQRVVRWQLAKRQSGTHKTKERAEITGSTQKMYKQKGTGRARQGSGKGTQFRGGGTAFGPRVRSHDHDLTKKFRKLGLRNALSAKQAAGQLMVLDSADLSEAKTKALVGKLSGLGLKSALVIDGGEVNQNFAMAARNIPLVDVLPEQGANVYDILRRDTLVLTKAAIQALEARL